MQNCFLKVQMCYHVQLYAFVILLFPKQRVSQITQCLYLLSFSSPLLDLWPTVQPRDQCDLVPEIKPSGEDVVNYLNISFLLSLFLAKDIQPWINFDIDLNLTQFCYWPQLDLYLHQNVTYLHLIWRSLCQMHSSWIMTYILTWYEIWPSLNWSIFMKWFHLNYIWPTF